MDDHVDLTGTKMISLTHFWDSTSFLPNQCCGNSNEIKHKAHTTHFYQSLKSRMLGTNFVPFVHLSSILLKHKGSFAFN
jgi:hypothetical protein